MLESHLQIRDYGILEPASKNPITIRHWRLRNLGRGLTKQTESLLPTISDEKALCF